MTMKKQERSLSELYADDPERADALVFGRRTDVSRRGFMGGAGLAAVGVAVGGTMPFADNMPAGLVPAVLAQDKPADAKPAEAKPAEPQPLNLPGKDKNLIVLGDKPLNAETPAWMLDDDVTPVESFYIRTHGTIPEAPADPDKWVLTIDGEVDKKLELTLGEIKSKFKVYEHRMVLECAGNGRSFFSPPASGNQWTTGGVGCAMWKGVRLADVLKAAGLKPSAVYTAHYGTDQHLSGDPNKQTLSRGVPIDKAMDDYTLLVWEMNGKPLIAPHGAPLRLVVPGWVGSCSHKWLSRIWIRDKEHDGQGMQGASYRMPSEPIVPGSKPDTSTFKIMTSMPVKSVITSPKNGAKFDKGVREVKLRGAAWDGGKAIKAVEISIDYGASWKAAELGQPQNPYDWVRWTANVKLPSDGYFEIFARATDSDGVTQPAYAANWNPSGYGANPYHRIAILVG